MLCSHSTISPPNTGNTCGPRTRSRAPFLPCGTAPSARRAASRIRRRSRWCSSWSTRRRKAGAGSMATTSCPSSFKVSGSPMGSKSPPTRRPRSPKPPPPEPSGHHQHSAIALGGRQLLQCRQCRYQTSLIAGTVLQGTKLPMRVWFRAMHLLAPGKKGLSNIELGRRLGISTNAAWRFQHKLMQAMIERDRRYKLGASGPRTQIDDAYIGGERTGEGSGRGRRGHTPFIIAVETSKDGRPLYARLQVVRGFQTGETKRLCARIAVGTIIVSDGGQWFRCIAWQPGLIHQRHVTGSDRTAARHPAFRWANTVLANVKNSLLATHRAVAAKHLPRYLGAFAWRFNRRVVLKTIHERLAIAAAATPPMPYRLLKLAEARW